MTALIPVAQSHTWVNNGGNPNGSPTSFGRHGSGGPHPDPCRYYDPKVPANPFLCNNYAGISGTYVTSAGAWIINVTNTSWKNATPGGGDDILSGFLLALCDAEILSDGNPATVGDNALDETNVDGVLTTGVILDGLIDDGGTGGACHTSGHYLGPYNSPGCGTGVHALAHVSDALVGDEVEAVAGCDWKAVSSGGGGLLTYLTCVINAILGGQPGKITGECQDVLDCIINPLLCPGGFVSCGSQGSADAAKTGGTLQDPTFWGGTGGHWPNFGIPFPSAALIAADGCLQTDSSAVVWVVNAATTGWIHSTGTSLAPFPANDK